VDGCSKEELIGASISNKLIALAVDMNKPSQADRGAGAGLLLMHGYSVEYPNFCEEKYIHIVYSMYMYKK